MRKKVKGRGGPRRGSGRRPSRKRSPRGKEGTRRNVVRVTVYDAQYSKLQRLAEKQGLPVGTVAFDLLAKCLGEVKMPRQRK